MGGFCINAQNAVSNVKRKIYKYAALVFVFVIGIALFLMFPFIVPLVYMVTLVFGEPVSYIAGGIVSNLYIPLMVVLIMILIYFAVKFIFLNLALNKAVFGDSILQLAKPPLTRAYLKSALITLVGFGFVVVFAFHSMLNIFNLVLDIQNLASSDFAKMDGTLTLYEVSYDTSTRTFMQINGTRFEGGFSHGGELVEGEKYHVEYLPHSKYVVKYRRDK